MGVVIPQVITEDKADAAQIIDGSVGFRSDRSYYLSRTPGSVGNRKTWTWSGWVKRSALGTDQGLMEAFVNSNTWTTFFINSSNELQFQTFINGTLNLLWKTTAVFRDCSSWYHIVITLDTIENDPLVAVKIYVNGNDQLLTTTFSTGTYVKNTNYDINNTVSHRIGVWGFTNTYFSGLLSNVHFIDGQVLNSSYFGYRDPLTNTWRPKKYTGTYGTNGFYLPMDGNTLIGQDRSGNNNNWTPVNFGGSNTLEKATGALPILNTDGGGKVARVGVRTDSNASSLVLALPLVGIATDFSNRINSGTSNKAITAAGNAAASSTQSNFYGGSFAFDGVGDYLETSTSNDFVVGTGDFTLEAWYNVDASQTTNPRLFGQNINNSSNWDCYINSTSGTNTIYMHGGSTNLGMSFPSANTWHHFCIVRSSGVLYSFMNGVLRNTQAYTNSVGVNNLGFRIGEIGPNGGSGYTLKGYVQDFRLYKGLAKYTQNFIPASTDPDILPDTPSGVSYSSSLVPITDGAVAFNGSTQYLSLADSADWAFGSGNFTIETFAYLSTGSSLYFGQGDGATPAFVVFGNIVYIGPSIWTSQFQFIDPPKNKWFHFAFVRNGNVLRVYIDGVVSGILDYSGSWPDATDSFTIGQARTSYSRGFYSNFHVVKGTALYTTDFTPPTVPITPVANTKLLCCKSNSSATLADAAPGTITVNGSAIATNFNPFTVNINTVRGQESGYCTLNPLDKVGTNIFGNGNLDVVVASGGANVVCGNIDVSSGKWYWEVLVTSSASNAAMIGVANFQSSVQSRTYSTTSGLYYYGFDGTKYTNNAGTSYGASYTVGDLISVALDMDNGTVTFYKNGVSQGVAFNSGILGNTMGAVLGNGTSGGTQTYSTNFGQKPFKFPPPAGFQPLALANTPRPTIVRPDQYVGIVTYTGTGASLSLSTQFKPDLVWIKSSNTTQVNALYDSVRGVGNVLSSQLTFGDTTIAQSLTSFDKYGFTVGTAATSNTASYSYVAWCWKAGGGTGVTTSYWIDDKDYGDKTSAGLTSGTIAPTGASINTKSGFSIITYTGDGTAGATVAHGLGTRPAFIIIKSRTTTSGWPVWHKNLTGTTGTLWLNLEYGETTLQNRFNSTGIDSNVIKFGSSVNELNSSLVNYVAYSWAEIPGFSKFGLYTGIDTENPYIRCGFRPRWVMIKRSDSSPFDWFILDTARDTYNPTNKQLTANRSSAEASSSTIDVLSNGFRLLVSANSDLNKGAATYIYAAFAESPSFNLYGGQANAR